MAKKVNFLLQTDALRSKFTQKVFKKEFLKIKSFLRKWIHLSIIKKRTQIIT